MTGLELTGRTIEKHAVNSHLPQPAPAPLPQRRPRVNAKFFASIRRRGHGAKVGGADSLRLERTSAKESGGVTHRRVWRRKLWGSRQSQALEAVAPVQKGRKKQKQKPKGFCAAIDSSHWSDAETAAAETSKSPEPSCGVVFDIYIVSSQRNAVVATKAQTQAYNDAVQQKGRGHGLGPPFIWAWAGLVQGLITEGTKLGEVLAPLSDHMEELNKLSVEERCGMVKHCRIDKTFDPQQEWIPHHSGFSMGPGTERVKHFALSSNMSSVSDMGAECQSIMDQR